MNWGKPLAKSYFLKILSILLLPVSLLLLAGNSKSLEILKTFHSSLAHQFFEVPQLAAIRAETQLVLLRYHLGFFLLLLFIFTLINQRLTREIRGFLLVLLTGALVRSVMWIIGGNLPLVPGDSCHYIETANSVAMGLPSSKHYVESFFRDYPSIRQGKPVLDDWATPLYADLLGFLFRLTGAGIGPEKDLAFTFGLAKGLSYFLNLITLPCLYFYVRRCISPRVALPAMALAAILPVHAIYAGFALRESLVALTSLLAVWLTMEMKLAERKSQKLAFAFLGGISVGLAILSRNTAMALAAGLLLWLLIFGGKRNIIFLMIWGLSALAVITPWAWLTYQAYGKPFYSYTEHFAHTFSWTVHHYAKGIPDRNQFFSAANLPEVIRVKIKAILILSGYSTMILSLPVMIGFGFRLIQPKDRSAIAIDRLSAFLFLIFAAATVARIADVTQVAQLGRYYLPVYLIMIPTAVRGLQELLDSDFTLPNSVRILASSALIGCLWADPTWAYDASWFVKPFQLHWPALVDAGQFLQKNPMAVPESARVMSWFPWEMRVTSNRITVLMPRNFDARRISEVQDQYGVSHIVWGSFEIPPHVDPETFGPYLSGVRTTLGLNRGNEIYRTPQDKPYLYPVTIYQRTSR